ncbi:hypothetical protein BH20ACI4_BH20ACI4_03440 [soil metagenome]
MIAESNISTTSTVPYINGAGFESSLIYNKPEPIFIFPDKVKSIDEQKKTPRFELEFPDFDHKFNFEVIKIEGELSASEIVFYLKLDDNVIKAILSGNRQKGEGLYINNIGFGDEVQGQTPISVFLLKSLWAMSSLSKEFKIQIPDFNQEATISFDTNLNKVSELLQIRQVAYRMLVIEKTLRVKLPFPQFIDSKNFRTIAYCYHSIIDRKFKWLWQPRKMPWIALQKYVSLLPKENVPFSFQEESEPIKKEIFDHQIDLGLQTGKIEDAVVENFEEVKKELSKLDGREVLAQISSKSGVVQIESITTPHLPEKAFSKDIQKLIDLEEKLDTFFFDKYLNSFSDAFEDLTDEQIQAITERPDLEEEAFNF